MSHSSGSGRSQIQRGIYDFLATLFLNLIMGKAAEKGRENVTGNNKSTCPARVRAFPQFLLSHLTAKAGL